MNNLKQEIVSDSLLSEFKSCRNMSQCATSSQLAITCSKLTIETLEQGVKYVQS